MKSTAVWLCLIAPLSLRRAWLIRRACRPTWLSPISPSISARGTSAATESSTITSIAPERTSDSVISRACSAVSGWLMYRFSTSTPIRSAKLGSSACSISTKAQMPPRFWASRTTCRQNVVLPALSGP